jgi:hypothetical protein
MMEMQTIEATIECDERNQLPRLEAQLRIGLRDYVFDFRMTVRDGGLVLYGRARSFYAKQLAQQAVMQRSRLAIRANNINVL